jgi:hypothetical protein
MDTILVLKNKALPEKFSHCRPNGIKVKEISGTG